MGLRLHCVFLFLNIFISTPPQRDRIDVLGFCQLQILSVFISRFLLRNGSLGHRPSFSAQVTV